MIGRGNLTDIENAVVYWKRFHKEPFCLFGSLNIKARMSKNLPPEGPTLS